MNLKEFKLSEQEMHHSERWVKNGLTYTNVCHLCDHYLGNGFCCIAHELIVGTKVSEKRQVSGVEQFTPHGMTCVLNQVCMQATLNYKNHLISRSVELICLEQIRVKLRYIPQKTVDILHHRSM